jgi:hypothetical protein
MFILFPIPKVSRREVRVNFRSGPSGFSVLRVRLGAQWERGVINRVSVRFFFSYRHRMLSPSLVRDAFYLKLIIGTEKCESEKL